MYRISATIDVDAPAGALWEVLTDGAAHAEWNPFVTRLDGTITVGSRLNVRIAPPGGRAMTFRPVVTVAEPGRRLEWLGRLGVPGMFDGRHSFTLVPLPNGRTRLIQAETFTGLLVPVARRGLARTEEGFREMNRALARRVEGRASSPAADRGAA